MGFEYEIKDNSPELLIKLDEVKKAILEAWGLTAESHARNIVTRHSRVDTGALRNSIGHQVMAAENSVYVGTNQDYAIYNELGTGIYVGGRQTPWSYQDASGNWHRTRGLPPIHMIKNSVDNFKQDYKKIAEELLKEVSG